jgi:hypothetical protein
VAHPSPPAGGCFVVPAWWTKPTFNLSEIAQFLDTPISTVSFWLTLARAAGLEVGDQSGNRTRYSCHDVFALSLLAKLRIRHVRINAMTVFSAFVFAGKPDPRPVAHNGEWVVYSEDGVNLTVPAWLCWTAVRAWASKYFGTAHA